MRHGAKVKQCSSERCTNYAQKGGVCVRHGAKRKRYECSAIGCTNIVVKGGVCKRHGANSSAQDGSTAFGSEFERTTAAETQTNQGASEAASRGSERRSVPEEVTILCQEIVEV